jgi:hypothetical protein
MSKALGISILNLIATQAHRSTLVRKGYLLALRILPRLTQRTRSALYWERRYVSGGTSGPGSYGKFATFKADVLNGFVQRHGIRTVIEFGCGDGNQLRYANYQSYLGYDVSHVAISRCRCLFRDDPGKQFMHSDAYCGQTAELCLSLDVIYHLLEETSFESYVRRLFSASRKFVILYTSDTDENPKGQSPHIQHRNVTTWIARNIDGWQMIERIPNRFPYAGDSAVGSFADFLIYGRKLS